MSYSQRNSEQHTIIRRLARWAILLSLLSVTTGSLVALFLWLLDAATRLRWAHEWLTWLLPLAGIGIYCLYRIWGRDAEKGNNLIIDEIHEPGGGVPARMTPLVLISTVITHLFGGSAGREGTAVQMGGSIAGLYGKWYRLTPNELRILLMAGIAAGFGAVFGTPLAGTIFALEVVVIGSKRYSALLPCLVASVLADMTTAAWGQHHTHYSITTLPAQGLLHFDGLLLLKTLVAGLLFGLVAYCFSRLSHTVKNVTKKWIRTEWLIPVAGGITVLSLCYILGTTDYLGLGVTGKNDNSISIVNAFHAGGATYWSWLWKLLFTVITLSTGFKGGEVTPLFFIGATLGNTAALLCGAPVDVFAAMGFIAVFAGATNTPLACTIMGIELFGGAYGLYFAVACFMAYYASGHTGIYTAQRVGVWKIKNKATMGKTIQELHEAHSERRRKLWDKLWRRIRK